MNTNKNALVTVRIEDIGSDGEGIGKVEGYTLFIKDAIIGDLVEAKIMKAKKNFAYARLEKVIEPSSFRVTPPCEYYRSCGGCQLQALSFEKQLHYKENKVKNHLLRIGGMNAEPLARVWEPIVGMEEPFFYRITAQFPIGQDRSDEHPSVL